MLSYDVWAVSPAAASTTYFRAAAAIAGAGALTLLQTNFAAAGAINGCGYLLTITSSGNDSGTTYTIVGIPVGSTVTTTVTQAGGNPTSTGTTYWQQITSITAGSAATGNVSIGFAAGLALPRTRIKGVYYVGAASAGSIAVTMNGTSGQTILNIDTPASATVAQSILLPMHGVLVARSSPTDFGVVTLTQVTKATLFCG
jgi:uncharacterized metal-binding protein